MRTFPGRAAKKFPETAIKEKLNATNIVFVRACREPASVAPITRLIPQKVRADFARRWKAAARPPASRRVLAKLPGKPEIRGRGPQPRSLFKFSANYVNLTERKRVRREREKGDRHKRKQREGERRLRQTKQKI